MFPISFFLRRGIILATLLKGICILGFRILKKTSSLKPYRISSTKFLMICYRDLLCLKLDKENSLMPS